MGAIFRDDDDDYEEEYTGETGDPLHDAVYGWDLGTSSDYDDYESRSSGSSDYDDYESRSSGSSGAGYTRPWDSKLISYGRYYWDSIKDAREESERYAPSESRIIGCYQRAVKYHRRYWAEVSRVGHSPREDFESLPEPPKTLYLSDEVIVAKYGVNECSGDVRLRTEWEERRFKAEKERQERLRRERSRKEYEERMKKQQEENEKNPEYLKNRINELRKLPNSVKYLFHCGGERSDYLQRKVGESYAEQLRLMELLENLDAGDECDDKKTLRFKKKALKREIQTNKYFISHLDGEYSSNARKVLEKNQRSLDELNQAYPDESFFDSIQDRLKSKPKGTKRKIKIE